MAWVYLDDLFCDHPKVAGLSDAAFRLHVAGLCHCARHLTDGLVQADDVPRLVRRFARRSLGELVDRALWVPVDMGGPVAAAYAIHDYLRYQRSREQVVAAREAAAARKRRSRGADPRPPPVTAPVTA